jgi:transposase
MGFRKVDFTTEQMQAMRDEGLSNDQIAERCSCSRMTVYLRIGAKKPYGPRKVKEEIAEQAQS